MSKNKNKTNSNEILPLLKPPELMSKICGIGENKLRELMENGELEYLQNGNRRLLLDEAVLDYYHRNKTPAKINFRKETI